MTSEADGETKDLRIYFAAERTLLAWIRTGLSMMGFGFVVARFGLFLREMAEVQHLPPTQPIGLSVWAGTAMILLGVIVSALGAAAYLRTLRRLERGEPLHFSPFSLAVGTAVALAVIGVLMAGYLSVLAVG